MARDREHHVVMIRRHDFDLGTEPLPELLKLCERVLISVLGGRQNAPAPVEELSEPSVRSRLLGASNRMPGDEVDAFRHMRRDIAHGGGLDRADVRDDRAFLQLRADGLRDGLVGSDGRAQDDEIGAAHGIGRIGVHLRNEAKLFGAFARCGCRGRADDFANQSGTAGGVTDRRADQADADQRQALEHRPARAGHSIFHHAAPFRNCASAAMARLLSSSEPMVMRSALGKP